MARNHRSCPILATLDILHERWTLHILGSLLEEPKRFNELRREQGINPRTLCQRLRSLEQEGLIFRSVISETPPNVEYHITEKGRELGHVFESLAAWGRRWMEPEADASSLASQGLEI